MIFHARNLREVSVKSDVLPWDFKIESEISHKVRTDKPSRQIWYKAPSTNHHFYSLLEGSNPNLRVSKENNPPRLVHGFVADFDLPITFERAMEAVASMKLKPQWMERSLGGNLRLLWLLEQPIVSDDYDFTVAILNAAVDWLQLGLLPGLDEPAFITPTRLMCNGGEWRATGFTEPVSRDESQAFFVRVSKEFSFQSADPIVIPLDVVESELKKKYPNFNWPADFAPDSTGPTFWIPESTSPASAILKPEGFITFSAHAAKPFYSWGAILGAEFVKDYATKSIAKATNEIYWDGHKFWRRSGDKNKFVGIDMPELQNYFLTRARLSSKPDKTTGISQVAEALDHIYNANRVAGAAPFCGRKDGVIIFMNEKVLNTYVDNSIIPHDQPCQWGVDFPFLSALLDHLFFPAIQLNYVLAWLKYAYTCARRGVPQPGQNCFLMGDVGSGKTLFNREIVGRLLGGYVDASQYLVRGGEFNSELFDKPLWVVDDETPGNSEAGRNNFSAMLKKSTANNTFRHNKKFQAATMTEWAGRIFATTNLDHVSSRIVGNLDNSSRDKTNLFRCNPTPFKFPSREQTIANIEFELPKFARWLLDWNPPLICVPDHRFGYKSYQEDTLLVQANQSSKVAPFREILFESLRQWFDDEKVKGRKPEAWTGTTVALTRLILMTPMNEQLFRSLRIEQTARYLEVVARDDAAVFSSITSDKGERLWVYKFI